MISMLEKGKQELNRFWMAVMKEVKRFSTEIRVVALVTIGSILAKYIVDVGKRFSDEVERRKDEIEKKRREDLEHARQTTAQK